MNDDTMANLPPPADSAGRQNSTFSPVTVRVSDSLGALFLGIVSLTLLIAYLRSEGRNRALAAHLAPARHAPPDRVSRP